MTMDLAQAVQQLRDADQESLPGVGPRTVVRPKRDAEPDIQDTLFDLTVECVPAIDTLFDPNNF